MVVSGRRRARLPGPVVVVGREGRVVVEVRGAQSVGLLLAAGWERERTGDWEWTDRATGSGQAHSSLGIRKQRAARARGERQSYRGQSINDTLICAGPPVSLHTRV